MASIPDYLTKGFRIFFSSIKNKCYTKKYPGNAKEICQQIVKDCWNEKYFQTSATNFREFWSRDFGWCTQSLLKLGYEKEVQQTLRYTLNRYKKYNKVTTTINFRGKPYDVFEPAVDSLPWLIHSIKISKFPYHSYKTFLNVEIRKYFEYFIDHQTNLVKTDLRVSSMKDFSIRKSSCYDNCMVGLLAKDLNEMKLDNPFKKINYSTLIKKEFWNGDYFYDDLKKKDYIAGDANLFPFILGLFTDKEMLKSAVKKMQEEGLDKPFPLKYTKSRIEIRFNWQELFFRDYESNSVWTHMGPLFVKLVEQIDKEKAEEYKQKYTEMIEKYHSYPEVLFANGKPFKSLIYHSDMRMLWACNYLTL
ncbi:MAG: hypothetical protein ABIH82_02890 [Candidatus Woesearchaeota archaeon]